MAESFPRRKQPRVANPEQETSALPSGEQQAPVDGVLLLACDEIVVCLMNLSRLNGKSSAQGRKRPDQQGAQADIQYIERMVSHVVATVPEDEDEMMGKAAVYREYANFRDRQPELLAIMLHQAGCELELRTMGLKTPFIEES